MPFFSGVNIIRTIWMLFWRLTFMHQDNRHVHTLSPSRPVTHPQNPQIIDVQGRKFRLPSGVSLTPLPLFVPMLVILKNSYVVVCLFIFLLESRHREPGEYVKKTPFPTFCPILEALRVECTAKINADQFVWLNSLISETSCSN